MRTAPTDRSNLATTGQEYLDLLHSDADWIIRTPGDMVQLRTTEEGPLAKLPEDDFRAFVDGLVFAEGGVAGGSYKALMSTLGITEIFEVFERFGMSRGYALETHDAECNSTTKKCDTTVFSFCPDITCHKIAEKKPPEAVA